METSALEAILGWGDWDFGEVWGYATTVRLVMPENESERVETNTFAPCDVQEVYGHSEGENDTAARLVAGRLTDGRHFFLAAGCDYTGWG